MATIVMCDRCGRFGKAEALGAILFKPVLSEPKQTPRGAFPEPERKAETKEICPECVASFIDWFDAGKGKGEAQPPFNEPYTEPPPPAPTRLALADRVTETR